MAVRDLDGIFDNLPPPWRGPRRPGQQRSGALTAADIVAGRSPFGQQSVSQFDDPTISGQLQQAFEHGAERAGLGSQGQGYAGAVGNFIGQSTGLDMPKYLSDAYNCQCSLRLVYDIRDVPKKQLTALGKRAIREGWV